MTESDVLSLHKGDKYHIGDGVTRTVKGEPVIEKGWFGKIKSITFMVTFDDGSDFVTGHVVGYPEAVKDWKFL